jgi:hypothetical protein
MSLVGKNRNIFSYNNENREGSKFIYKDFEKTKSYNSKFASAEFRGTSLRGAQMKFCDFTGCTFSGVDFIGTNLRGSNFTEAKFFKCIFSSTVFERANFKNAVFENCYMAGTSLKKAKNVPDHCAGVKIVSEFPPLESISNELLQLIQSLRENDIIRRSHTLHGKNGKINQLSLMILEESYTEDELIRYFRKLPEYVTTQFYTYSHLEALLKKIAKESILQMPGTLY